MQLLWDDDDDDEWTEVSEKIERRKREVETDREEGSRMEEGLSRS